MDWTGPNRGKLRKALLEIYTDSERLKLFTRDNFDKADEILKRVEGNSVETWAASLIEKLDEEGLIPELYAIVCQEHSEHSAIQELYHTLKGAPVMGHEQNLPKAEAEDLFASFSPYDDDFGIVKKSFLCAYKAAFGDFREIRPEHPPLTELIQIQKLLELYNPKLAVRFAEYVMVEFKEEGQDLTAVTQWRDRIANQYNISLSSPPSVPVQQQGYLLVSLKGRVQDDSFIVYAELHVTDKKDPVPFFDRKPVIRTLDEVPQHLSALIHHAEEALADHGSGRITLELFLPCEYLDINVARWEVSDIANKRGRSRPLGNYRRFVIRSFERAVDKATQAEVNRKWRFLQDCDRNNNACDQFHLQDTCPTAGDLLKYLRDKPGLKLLTERPEDQDDYLDILDDIIDSAVPMALWFCAVEDMSAADKLTAFDTLLQSCCGNLTDFSELAGQRDNSSLATSEHFRLLCDRPDRWPTLPSQRDPLRDPPIAS